MTDDHVCEQTTSLALSFSNQAYSRDNDSSNGVHSTNFRNKDKTSVVDNSVHLLESDNHKLQGVFSFGDNSEGCCGLGSLESSRQPIPAHVATLANKKVVQVVCGHRHVLVLTMEGEVYSFGSNKFGECGTGVASSTPIPTPVPITTVNYDERGCSLDDEGRIQTINERIPKKASIPVYTKNGNTKIRRVVFIAAGYSTSFALTDDDRVYVWGRNESAALGLGISGGCVHTPVMNPYLSGLCLVEIASGGVHGLALTKQGVVYGWGGNSYGQAGFPSGSGASSVIAYPTIIASLQCTHFSHISCGKDMSFVISTQDDEVWAFGYNAHGELGLGHLSPVPEPQQVVGLQSKGIIQIAAGIRHVLALSSSELVYAWGENNYGQLGDGTVENSTSIKEIHILQNRRVTQVSVSEFASFAVTIHGELFVWGSNEKHVHGHPSASGFLSPRLATWLSHLETSQVVSGLQFTIVYQNARLQKEIPSSSLMNDWIVMLETGQFTDVTIFVGSQRTPLRAHRLVLITRCDVFRRMFLTDCVESRTGNIEVPDVAPNVYQLFLRYLYGDQISIPLDFAIDLLALGDRYDLPRLKALCEDCLRKHLTITNAAKIFEAASLYDSKELKQVSLQFISNHFGEVVKTNGFACLDKHLILDILVKSPSFLRFSTKSLEEQSSMTIELHKEDQKEESPVHNENREQETQPLVTERHETQFV
ncbi:hypothetical protein GpartN1_g6645.t1 [Galdieria partita]|uniref:BTB domain-containing protein n=1 Tax=Galdieria partita TaxID=83374 RepID=A0A9C7Q2Y0_9RHOD|nr:hypothetical protein GpartN1_g6645.t1 [Galdieria partita]